MIKAFFYIIGVEYLIQKANLNWIISDIRHWWKPRSPVFDRLMGEIIKDMRSNQMVIIKKLIEKF